MKKKSKLNNKHAAIFKPDTGTTVPIIPRKVAIAHDLDIKTLDWDDA